MYIYICDTTEICLFYAFAKLFYLILNHDNHKSIVSMIIRPI